MRNAVLALILAGLPAVAVAQDDALETCAQTEAWFNLAVDSRKMGEPKRTVQTTMRDEMDRAAADQLVEFVYALPEGQLTHAVGAMARQQCEGL
ncbi:hypothetical protein GGQ68_002411 [Sagittula marina]|uniref:Uncharacterized protein n=1 Tax=Sagittula marina TaxID=943940 RepID=A0A7W6GSZ4_9RHOB|nr:hypothetical protein [Sagittula marina]MBB3986073.1 hypothetical protein [Sagittula marina]